ncbi:Golgin subfamily member 7/ERF4 family-domain-containing protein [Salix suchowensis]|nr:Golgin subfamily member 7/ERF4 family-domain-containing protein [Salix suchowensis]
MTEAHHDLPSSEPEPRAAGLVDKHLPHDDNTHNPATTIAASTSTRALINSTADSASTSGAELGPGTGPSLVDNSNNSEGVAAASSRMLTVEEAKGSFLELARTPEPDLEADGEDEYASKGDIRGARESDQEVEVDGNTNSSNVPEPAADGTTTNGNDFGYEVEEENETTIRDDSWHPLSPHVPPKQEKGVEDDEEAVGSGQDMTMVVEEEDVVDSRGRLMYSVDEVDEKLSAVNSPRRASHLRLNLKASSPQPWELVDPPDSNGHQTKPEHELESRFHSLQSR